MRLTPLPGLNKKDNDNNDDDNDDNNNDNNTDNNNSNNNKNVNDSNNNNKNNNKNKYIYQRNDNTKKERELRIKWDGESVKEKKWILWGTSCQLYNKKPVKS